MRAVPRTINPWELLNVKAGDSEDILRTRYKQTMLRVHPDRPGGSRDKAAVVNHCYQLFLEHLVNGCVPSLADLGRAGLPVAAAPQQPPEPRQPPPPRWPQAPPAGFWVPLSSPSGFWSTTASTTASNVHQAVHITFVVGGFTRRGPA
jgi:hypothetical protein